MEFLNSRLGKMERVTWIFLCVAILSSCQQKTEGNDAPASKDPNTTMCAQVNQTGFNWMNEKALLAISNIIPDKEKSTSLDGMVKIKGGSFQMGGQVRIDVPEASIGSQPRPDEFPNANVEVSSFWMDATEVTNAE